MRLTQTIFLCALVFLSSQRCCRADVEFDRVNGSDLIMGIGARAIGMGGAFVSVSDDASAIFWNPSGLTQLSGSQLFFSAYAPPAFSAAALIYKPAAPALENRNFAVGLGLVNRLDFKGDSGSGTWEGYPAHLLDLAMIDVGADFSGDVTSRTRDMRLSLSMASKKIRHLSLGVNLVHVS